MLEMYAPMVNSPITELATAIDDTQTTIEVVDGSKLPDAPNLAMIGSGENTETILYTQKDGNVLSGVTRGFQGIAKAWPQGARVARVFAAYDQMAIQENIKTLDQSLAAHLNDKLQDGVHGLATTQDLTLYVDATNGDDSNDGLTPQTAFRTIQRAIDVLPRIIDHDVIIQLVDGTYNEYVNIIGFNGKGKLFIVGNGTNPTNVKVRSFAIGQNTCFVAVMDCEVTATDTNGISISYSGAPVLVSRVIIQTPSSVAAGIRLSFGVTSITQCTISNRYFGIVGYNLSRIHSYNNEGSGNTFALYIGEGSVLAKNGSQPTGATNEYTWAGGVIR